jgi:tetratricopeptide (TPR) repeat protein
MRFRMEALIQFRAEARLANSRFTGHQHHLAVAGLGVGPAPQRLIDFLVTADQWCQRRPAQRLEPALNGAGAQHLPSRYRPGEPADLDRAEISVVEQTADNTSLCFALYISVRFNLLSRSEQAAFAAFEELASVATEHRLFYFQILANVLRALLPSKTGSVVEGIARARQSISAEAARGTIHNLAYHLGLLAQASEGAGQSEEALDTLTRAVEIVDRTDERWFEAELYRLRGEWLIAHRNGEQAEASFERARAVARRQSAKMWELRPAVSFARLHRDQCPPRGSARPPRPRLRVVHRGLRHPRSQRGKGAARRVELSR